MKLLAKKHQSNQESISLEEIQKISGIDVSEIEQVPEIEEPTEDT